MRHPDSVWADPSYATEPLERVWRAYRRHLGKREVSRRTVDTYEQGLSSLFKSIAEQGEPAVLASVTPEAVDAWVEGLWAKGRKRNTVATYIRAVKAFSKSYLKKQGITTVDLLEHVERLNETVEVSPRLDDDELEDVLAAFGTTYEGIRDRALLCVYLSTGARFSEILGMTLSGLDRLTGEFEVVAKGGKTLPKACSPAALKAIRKYLQRRPSSTSDALWLTAEGRPLGYGAGQKVAQAIRRRSGVARFHWHLCRHTFAQVAIEKDAERGLVQDMLGHESDRMTRRYNQAARVRHAARSMPQFSPV